MKAVILAGGLGTRISEETAARPKPMVEIGGRPILWHIMKIYSAHGIHDFVICCGYKGYQIKEYFANYHLRMCDVTLDLAHNSMQVHQNNAEPWRVTLVETGEHTATGGRLARVRPYLDDDDFCFTYGDGVSDVDIGRLIRFHREQGTLATVTVVQPPSRFGVADMQGGLVTSFREKPQGEGGWVNGGFFVLSPPVLDLIEGDDTVWELGPMEHLARSGQLSAHRHEGFWYSMDTQRDKVHLDRLCESGRAPWMVW